MANPSIEELRQSENFELIAELHHSQIKEFVLSRFTDDNRLIKAFMFYQIAMVVLGIFAITRGIVLALRESSDLLWWSIGGLVFSFTAMVPVHELLHGIAIWFTGARRIHFGAYFKKFIFYAEADRHVMNRKQFAFVALTPLVFVQTLTLAGLFLFWDTAPMYLCLVIMSVHSLFCAGDVGLLSVFYQDKGQEIFTFDVKSEKKSYYYQQK